MRETGVTPEFTRDGRFWLVHIPEIDRHTQARNLREIDKRLGVSHQRADQLTKQG